MAEAAGGRKPLLLCADDYGQGRGIDAGIAALVRAGRLNAFSCLTNGAAWVHDARDVAGLRQQAQAGLHLNLSEGRPLSPALAAHCPALPPLSRLIADAHLGRLPRAAVHAELDAQWQAFVDAAGVAPDFIDGHQHVHHLPGVRDWVLARARQAGVPVRSTGRLAGPGFALKRLLIAGTGGWWLARAMQRAAIAHNRRLLGAYDFVETDVRRLMRGWLAQVDAGGALLFCHPGLPQPGEGPDAIAAARQREYAYLAGDDFPRDLAEAGVTLAPAWRLGLPLFTRAAERGARRSTRG